MGERMTTIQIDGSIGYSDYGRRSAEEMIEVYRSIARRKKAEAEAVLSARNEDFRIETHTGVHVRRNVEVIQEGQSND